MLVKVSVKPGSKKGPLLEERGNDFVAYVRERAHEGEATDATITLIAKHFDIGKSRVQLVRGTKSRQKVFEIL